MGFPVAQRGSVFTVQKQAAFCTAVCTVGCSPYTWTTKSLERKPSIMSASPFCKGGFADRVIGDIRKLQRTPESGGGQPLPGTRMRSAYVCHRTGPRCSEISLQKGRVVHATAPAPAPHSPSFLSFPHLLRPLSSKPTT